MAYNYIYDQLVETEDDIHGIIAYSVYKRQKIQFIRDFKSSHNDNDPTEEDLRPFNNISTSTAQLEFYRSEATVLTQNFLENVLTADLEEREALFSAKVHTELANVQPRKWYLDILIGASGSLLFVMLTGVLYFAVWSLSTSPKMVIEQMFDVTIIPTEPPK